MIHLDTSFAIDLLRESRRGKSGPATSFLARLETQELAMSVFVACELSAGAELSQRPREELHRVEELCGAVTIAYPDARFATEYGRILAYLERRKTRIATMDLLIGTAALLAEAPLVTRNVRHFERIPDLETLSY